jgi:four helix bundle protein
MPFVNYENLDVYKLAFVRAIDIHRLSQDFPKNEQYGGLADQIRRSSKSVCANLAEGLAKQMSIPDKRKFIQISIGSVEETRVWLSFAMELAFITAQQGTALRDDYSRMAQMLFKLQKSLKF